MKKHLLAFAAVAVLATGAAVITTTASAVELEVAQLLILT
jgi:hypothetical protein